MIRKDKFNKEELEEIKSILESNEIEQDIDFYNDNPCFAIKKYYEDSELKGYAIVFLGRNSLLSNDLLLKEVIYWGEDTNHFIYFLKELILKRLEAAPDMDFYYNAENFDEQAAELLSWLGYKGYCLRR